MKNIELSIFVLNHNSYSAAVARRYLQMHVSSTSGMSKFGNCRTSCVSDHVSTDSSCHAYVSKVWRNLRNTGFRMPIFDPDRHELPFFFSAWSLAKATHTAGHALPSSPWKTGTCHAHRPSSNLCASRRSRSPELLTRVACAMHRAIGCSHAVSKWHMHGGLVRDMVDTLSPCLLTSIATRY